MGACGAQTHVHWNDSVGYWYVKCAVDNTAKGLHTGWKWPEDQSWTWCSDYRRKADKKRPPVCPREQLPLPQLQPSALEQQPLAPEQEQPPAPEQQPLALEQQPSAPEQEQQPAPEQQPPPLEQQPPVRKQPPPKRRRFPNSFGLLQPTVASEELAAGPPAASSSITHAVTDLEPEAAAVVASEELAAGPPAALSSLSHAATAPELEACAESAAVCLQPPAAHVSTASGSESVPRAKIVAILCAKAAWIDHGRLQATLASTMDAVWKSGAVSYSDYRSQASLASCARAFKRSVQVAYEELPFTQHSFPWPFEHSGSVRECTSSCTCIALYIAALFHERPAELLRSWRDHERWHHYYFMGAYWHQEYCKQFTLVALYGAMGSEALFASPCEIVARLSQLSPDFEPLKNLCASRALSCITDRCERCGAGSHPTGTIKCPCDGAVVVGARCSLRSCFQAMSTHHRSMDEDLSTFVTTVGCRSFFVAITGCRYFAADSHCRSWTGAVQDTSLLITGSWDKSSDLHGLLGEAICRGELGYKADVDEGVVFGWLQRGSGVARGDTDIGAQEEAKAGCAYDF